MYLKAKTGYSLVYEQQKKERPIARVKRRPA